MTELEKYTTAVAKRKAIDRRGTTSFRVNMAILLQLEEHDIPRLLEIMRVQDVGLRQLKDGLADESDSAEQCYGYADAAVKKAEELAASGSSATWGDADARQS